MWAGYQNVILSLPSTENFYPPVNKNPDSQESSIASFAIFPAVIVFPITVS